MQDAVTDNKDILTPYQPISFEDVDAVSIADGNGEWETLLKGVDLKDMPLNQLISMSNNSMDRFNKNDLILFLNEAARRMKENMSTFNGRDMLSITDDLKTATDNQLVATSYHRYIYAFNRIFIEDLFKEITMRLKAPKKPEEKRDKLFAVSQTG